MALLIPQLLFQGFSPNGGFLSGGLLYTYAAGSSVPAIVYQDPGLGSAWTNPVPLNSLGQALIYLNPGQAYKFNLTDSQGNQIPGYPVDQVNSNLSFPAIASNIVPATNDLYTLGTAGFSWAQVYVEGVGIYDPTTGNVGYYGQTAGENAASVTPTNYAYPPMCVDRYFTNTGTNDAAPAFAAAFQVAQKSLGGIITYGATGTYTTLSPINFTTPSAATQQYPIVLQGTGIGISGYKSPQIILNHGGFSYSHGFDLTGTQGMTFKDVSIGTGAIQPNTAIFQSRISTAGSVGICRFINVGIVGFFTVACYYNYGAEDCEVHDAYWQNSYSSTAASVVCITANNIKSQTSNYATVFSGSTSTTDHKFFGGQYYMLTANSTGSDVFYIEAIESLKVYGGWFFCSAAPTTGGGRSHVYCDMSNGPSNFCAFYGLSADTSGTNVANYFFLFSNSVQTPVGWVIDGVKSATDNFFLYGGGTSPTMNGFTIRGITEVNAHGISWPGSVTASFLDTRELAVVIGTDAHGNFFLGNKAQYTVTVSASRFINTHAGQSGPWGTPTAGLIVSNFPGSGATLAQCGEVLSTIITELQSEGILN
jgi:hypothetical protein